MAAIAATIARLSVGPVDDLWRQVCDRLCAAFDARGIQPRDSVILLPYAALIEPLRAAFAERPGWQPRIETVLTLAAALGPAEDANVGQCSGDAALDRLQAAPWLAALPPGVDREHAAALLAEAAAALAEAAAAQPPAARTAWLADLAAALPAVGEGSGAIETALLRAAAAWAAAMPTPATDRLFALRPAAWAVLRIGGADTLAEAVLQHADCGGWLVDLDPDPAMPFAPWVGRRRPRLLAADDFEAEAMAAAAEVLQALSGQGERVALVALDRALVRRIAALLQRQGVELDDETGWKLSTSAAAGHVLARLRAAAPSAGGDDRLDWLKRWPPAQAPEQAAALAALEAGWRNGRNARLSAAQQEAAAALWAQAEPVLQAWHQPSQRWLADWLALLARQLQDDGEDTLLEADVAGQRLLQLLHQAQASPAWRAALAGTRMDLPAFASWFGSWCELTTLQRSPSPGSRVVLTPLARAVGRPFGHVVLAGADAQRMGRDSGGPALIGDALAQRLGLETASGRRQRRLLALAQLLRAPGLSVLWRLADEGAALSPAAEIEALQAAWQAGGEPLPTQAPQLALLPVPAAPSLRPLPTAATQLPPLLSASSADALRQCPYRFFSRAVLRLGEAEEIDEPARKRDYGDWLHATLHQFHSHRQPGQDDARALQAAADETLAALTLDPADMLAFCASLQQLLPDYLDWLVKHEAAGWAWSAGETALQAAPEAWAPTRLRGVLDRVDRHADGRRQVLDYKTGSVSSLRARLVDPSEDTQLAFYVALLQAQPEPGLIEAAYLALDERGGPKLLPHADVAASATQLVEQLGAELQRLRAGAALPALGEGSLCDHCEARGLCRRDHWPAPVKGSV